MQVFKKFNRTTSLYSYIFMVLWFYELHVVYIEK